MNFFRRLFNLFINNINNAWHKLYNVMTFNSAKVDSYTKPNKENIDTPADKKWMLDAKDPARSQIVERAKALSITGSPDKAAHNLGPIQVMDGNGGFKEVTAYVLHAVDPVITDGKHVVMINRTQNPGKGLPALPGGLIDPTKGGGVESAVRAAAREAMEEAGVPLKGGELVGNRNMDRPFDIRVVKTDNPEGQKFATTYGLKEGDIFMVSTQAVLFHIPTTQLHKTKLEAGDDAAQGSARLLDTSKLTKPNPEAKDKDGNQIYKESDVGIPDHYDMIMKSIELEKQLEGKAAQRPEKSKFASLENQGTTSPAAIDSQKNKTREQGKG